MSISMMFMNCDRRMHRGQMRAVNSTRIGYQ